MKSLWKPVALAVLVATLGLAATSAAHTLELSRAAKATKTFSKLICEGINEEDPGVCVASQASSCHRLTDHLVRCGFLLTLNVEDGSQDRCLHLIEWSIRGHSSSLHPHYVGLRSCEVLRPPKEPTS